MISIQHFRDRIIIPALEAIGHNSRAAQELLLGTAIQESGLRHMVQLGDGPALGFFQMEPTTHDDIWLNYLSYKPDLAQRVENLSNLLTPRAMIGNLWYAAAMCRVHYLRVPKPLPAAGALNAQAAYWKTFYNTSKGKGSAAEYVANWNEHVPRVH